MIKYITLNKLILIILISISLLFYLTNINELYAQTMQSNKNQTNTEASIEDQTSTSKPEVSLWIPCMAAQGYLPGEFSATGFTPNSEVVLEINKNNLINIPPSIPITLVVKANANGTITGNFVLDRQINEDYFLHLYSFGDSPENYFYGGHEPKEAASNLITGC